MSKATYDDIFGHGKSKMDPVIIVHNEAKPRWFPRRVLICDGTGKKRFTREPVVLVEFTLCRVAVGFYLTKRDFFLLQLNGTLTEIEQQEFPYEYESTMERRLQLLYNYVITHLVI